MKHVAPVALSLGLLGLVGGVAAASAFGGGSPEPQRQVQLVQPADVGVTPSPTTTTATPSPTTTTVTPAPVESSKAPAPAPKVVQKKVIVSEQPADPTPEATPVEPAPSSTPLQPGQRPRVDLGTNDQPTPTSAK